jgi:hypothetical protein
MSIFMFGILCSSVIISGNVLGQDGEIILIDSDVTWVEDDFLDYKQFRVNYFIWF